MVFLGSKKQLDSITVVSYRGKKKVFEVGAVPNKLYEYKRNKSMPLEDVVHSTCIFADISRGELAKTEDIEREFGVIGEKAVKIILDSGTERRDSAVRAHELQSSLKAVKEGVHTRVRSPAGEQLTQIEIDALLKKVGHKVTTDPPKVQVSKIAKKAAALGYKRRTVLLRVSGKVIWEEVKSKITADNGSFLNVYESHIEITDDLYGMVLRHAEAQGATIEEIPEETAAEREI